MEQHMFSSWKTSSLFGIRKSCPTGQQACLPCRRAWQYSVSTEPCQRAGEVVVVWETASSAGELQVRIRLLMLAPIRGRAVSHPWEHMGLRLLPCRIINKVKGKTSHPGWQEHERTGEPGQAVEGMTPLKQEQAWFSHGTCKVRLIN